ncbi:MAG: hypothetical protein IPJ16_13650 [Bacteroidales bacterium]|nr:hypothetical protein [Bacteroidales bacterium]
MAKRKVIWSNIAVKRLFTMFESDIRRGKKKEDSVMTFKTISKNLKEIRKNPAAGIRTSEESVFVMNAGPLILLYSVLDKEIVIHTLLKV